MNSIISCLLSVILLVLFMIYLPLDPLDVGLILHEKSQYLSSNFTDSIRSIMDVKTFAQEVI